MKRRSILFGGAGVAASAAVATLLWRPEDLGGPHNLYFSRLNELLKRDGPGHPVLLIDLERLEHNVDLLTRSVGADKTYRVVVKSLPSVPLLEHVMIRAKTTALMVFHQPFLSTIAAAFPDSDVLMGKPMPINAAERFYRTQPNTRFEPELQLQWLIDSHQRLQQYQTLARQLGVRLRVNLEIDVGLHRGGFPEPAALDPIFTTIADDPEHLQLSGFMGYEPHLTGLGAGLEHPAVRNVLAIYRGFLDSVPASFERERFTLNGAGSHTLRIYERDQTMNDLAAGSGVVKPTDFDTHHLSENLPAVFIATPILKRYDELRAPGDPWLAEVMQSWDPNRRRLYYIYGGFWKARYVSPPGIADPIYHSTNQEPVSTSTSVDLAVDDYVFLRPTQSEHVMLQFGDLLVVRNSEFINRWPVFHQTGNT